MRVVEFLFVLIVTLISIVCPSSAESSPNPAQQLSARWELFQERLQANDLAAASDEINQLVMIRDGLGISALPTYASELVSKAADAEHSDNPERARILYRWALKLAPETPEILIRVLPVYKKYGLGSLFSITRSMVLMTWSSPFRLLTLFAQATYTVLGALSWTLYIAFIAIIAHDLISIFRVLAWYVRPALRGVMVPALFLGIFALPVFLGFLWCLTCWALAVLVILPERRRFSLAAGVLIFAWGVLIPVVENVSSWLRSEPVERVLLASDQPLRDDERQQLGPELSLWNSDAVVQFKFAQLLRRANQIASAEKILIFLEQAYGFQSWILAERGVLRSLQGDFTGAEKALRSAYESGDSSPEVIFNLSKIVFELNNTKESRELFGKALKKNKVRVEQMRKREEVLGIHDPRSYADVDLPLLMYAQAALIPNHVSFPRAEIKAGEMMTGLDPRLMALMGLVVTLLHLSTHQRSRRVNPKGLFTNYQEGRVAPILIHLIPGGLFFANNRFHLGLGILFVMVLTMFPVLSVSLSSTTWFFPYYVCLWLLAYFVLTLWSTQRGRE